MQICPLFSQSQFFIQTAPRYSCTALVLDRRSSLAGTSLQRIDHDTCLCRCKVSAEAVCKRDEMVFSAVLESGVPICMALSGGYAKDSAKVITQCLSHLFNKFQLIQKSSKL